MIALGVILAVVVGAKVFACLGIGMVSNVGRGLLLKDTALDANDPVTTRLHVRLGAER